MNRDRYGVDRWIKGCAETDSGWMSEWADEQRQIWGRWMDREMRAHEEGN